jgi:hypothetical protein
MRQQQDMNFYLQFARNVTLRNSSLNIQQMLYVNCTLQVAKEHIGALRSTYDTYWVVQFSHSI